MRRRQKPRLGHAGDRASNNCNLTSQERGPKQDQIPAYAVRRGGGAVCRRGRPSKKLLQVYQRYRPAMKRPRLSSSDESVVESRSSFSPDPYDGDTESLNGRLYYIRPTPQPLMRHAGFRHSSSEENEPVTRKVACKRSDSSDNSHNSTPSSPSEDEQGNRIPKLSAMEAEAVLRQELGIPDPVVAKKQALLDCMPSSDDDDESSPQQQVPNRLPSPAKGCKGCY